MHASDTTRKPLMPVEAVDLFAELLSDAEAGATDAFYSRLADATCLLADMRRAVIFAYDGDRRLVRAVGAHGIALDLFTHGSPTAEQVALAADALRADEVMEMDTRGDLPPEFHHLLDGGRVFCIPMAAGGRGIGVIVADRPAALGPLSNAQRHTLWSLGKIAGLAAAARHATHEHELANRLSERIDLARDLHDSVVQRLFGVALALAGEGDLDAEHRERAHQEVQAALSELRGALLPTGRRAPATTLQEELGRLRTQHPSLEIDVDAVEGDIPAVASSVLREAVRNATKHADPTRVGVRVTRSGGAFVLEVVNDGVPATAKTDGAGVGLRLAAFEALEAGGIVDFGGVDPDRWRVRLTVPDR